MPLVKAMCMLDTIRARRNDLYRVADRNKVDKLYVFGSCARKEESNDSDIDFLVDFNSQASLLNQVHLRDEFQEIFGRGVDVVSSRGLSPFLSKRILSEDVAEARKPTPACYAGTASFSRRINGAVCMQ